MPGPSIVAGPQAAHGVEPGEVALDHPPVAPQTILRFDAPPRDPGRDAAHPAGAATFLEVVALVCMQLPRAATRTAAATAPEGRNRIQHLLEPLAVIYVRGREPDGERNPLGIDHKMALAARSAFIRWIRTDNVAPLFAATVELSRAARLQSISSAQLNSCKSSRCRRFHTPRVVHRWKRRQQVEPLPQPISIGSSCHASAVRSTNRAPVRAWRFDTVTLRPPFLPGLGSGGSSGLTFAHKASLTRGFMPHGRLRDGL